MFRFIVLLIVLCAFSAAAICADATDSDQVRTEARIAVLLKQMTLEEKVSLLSGASEFTTTAIQHLGIHSMTFADGAHGVRDNHGGVATVYPAGIALAATWNVDMAHSVGQAIGEEAREHGVQVMLGPDINLVRSPLGGRNFETFGEDPVLTGRLAVAYVHGMQSTGVAATPKHFVANEQETERFDGSSNVDERTLHELYLAPFETVVRDARPWALMTAYNRLNGTFMSEHGDLLDQLLKQQWQFDGVVMSDWGAAHSVNVINHGLDLEMPGPATVLGKHLLQAVHDHLVSNAVIDEAVRRILRLCVRTGCLDDEYHDTHHQGHHVHVYNKIARNAASEAITLLKNDHGVLPLDVARTKRIAVIGPNADAAIIQGSGSSQLLASEVVTPLHALRAALPASTEVAYESGVDNEWSPRVLDARYFSPARDHKRDGLFATYYANARAAGRPVMQRVETDIGGLSFGGIAAERAGQMAVRWRGYFFPPVNGEYEFSLEHLNVLPGSALAGKKVHLDVKLLMDGKVILDDRSADSDYVTMTSLPTRAHAVKIKLQAAHVYSFAISYSATGLPYHALRVGVRLPVGGIAKAVQLARKSDTAIVFVGSSSTTDSEGRDRETIDLGFDQDELVEAIAAANPRTVVVINNGGPVTMPWIDKVHAVIDAWLPGQEGPRAIADVLLGRINPSGKLPVSFPGRLQDNPSYLFFPGTRIANYGEGIFVGYRYYDKKEIEPLFPFGFGLSYTTFDYQHLQVPRRINKDEPVNVEVDVRNTGSVAGAEVVQLYVSDKDCREACPIRELKAFDKVMLRPGETRTVSFRLVPHDFSHYDIHAHEWKIDEGEFEIAVGSSSRDLRQKAGLAVSE